MNKSELKERAGRLSRLTLEYMDNKRAISSLNAEQEKLKVKIDNKMVLNNCKVVFYGNEYIQKTDNPKVSINVAKFKSATNNKDFMSCLKVDVKKARKVLTEGQVKQIINTKSGDKFVTGVIEE